MKDKTRATGVAPAAYVVARDAYYVASNAAQRTGREAAVKRADCVAATTAYAAIPSAAHRADLQAARNEADHAELIAAIRRADCAAAGVAYEAAIDG